MKTVYVIGPYRAKTLWLQEANIRRAEEMARQVNEHGVAAVCVHSMNRFLSGTLGDDFWTEATLAILDQCDAAILTTNWRSSEGAMAEEQRCVDTGKPYFTTLTDLSLWLSSNVAASDAG